jgi:GT2 family glycosyltransferase
VVVLTWNGRRYLAPCLEALRKQTLAGLRVILVDNGSTDGTVDYVRAEFPEVQVVALAENIGFAAGNNAGIRAATGARYVLTLNNDTQAQPRWAEALVAAAEADPRVGIVASLMVFDDQPEVVDSAGIAAGWDGNGYNIGLGDPAGAHAAPCETFGACAGAALYRTAMLDEIGLFDERYFIYGEDTDLAFRAQLAGWRSVFAPEAVVWHIHSATMISGSPRKLFLLQRNRWWTLAKDWPLGLFVRGLPWIMWRDVASLGYALLVTRTLAGVRARLAALAGLPQALRERRRVQARRTRTTAELARRLSKPPSAAESLRAQRFLEERARRTGK